VTKVSSLEKLPDRSRELLRVLSQTVASHFEMIFHQLLDEKVNSDRVLSDLAADVSYDIAPFYKSPYKSQVKQIVWGRVADAFVIGFVRAVLALADKTAPQSLKISNVELIGHVRPRLEFADFLNTLGLPDEDHSLAIEEGVRVIGKKLEKDQISSLSNQFIVRMNRNSYAFGLEVGALKIQNLGRSARPDLSEGSGR
jgi:hypothetical protein